jgi:phosphoglycerate dehydrogenase-like enzyme
MTDEKRLNMDKDIQDFATKNKSNQYTDPTYNVLQLVEAATKRADDLRDAESKRVNEIMQLRAEYTEKLANAESKRIDAIRAVDVGAVAIASERAAQQAIVLANQVSASAETLRNLVSTTAAQVAQQLQQVSSQLIDRIALLEKSQYETKGTGLPNVIADRLEALEKSRSGSLGQEAGISKFIGWILAAVAIGMLVMKLLGK